MPESRIFANSNLSESPGRTKSLIQHSVSYHVQAGSLWVENLHMQLRLLQRHSDL